MKFTAREYSDARKKYVELKKTKSFEELTAKVRNTWLLKERNGIRD